MARCCTFLAYGALLLLNVAAAATDTHTAQPLTAGEDMDPSKPLLDGLTPEQRAQVEQRAQKPHDAVVGSLAFWRAKLASLIEPGAISLEALTPEARAAEPLHGAVTLMLLFAAACWLGSLATGNCSQVDKLWSITPFVYAWWFHVDADNGRTLLMALLATVWGLRLSYNFYRKGGYSGDGEDYRWPVLRGMMSPLAFQVFNLTFIALYQHVLLLLIALPAYVASVADTAPPLGTLDAAFGGALACALALETLADEQQWQYYAARARYRAAHAYKAQAKPKPAQLAADVTRFGVGDLRRGFLTGELFSLSRHPNFCCEQSIWVCFYALGAVAAGGGNEWCGGWGNPTALGVVLLIALFQGSTAFTESITLSKYGAYARYQETTSRLLPWFPGPRLGDEGDEDDEDDEEQEVFEELELELDPEALELMERHVSQVEAAAKAKKAKARTKTPTKPRRAAASKSPAPRSRASTAVKKEASPALTRGRSKSPTPKSRVSTAAKTKASPTVTCGRAKSPAPKSARKKAAAKTKTPRKTPARSKSPARRVLRKRD